MSDTQDTSGKKKRKLLDVQPSSEDHKNRPDTGTFDIDSNTVSSQEQVLPTESNVLDKPECCLERPETPPIYLSPELPSEQIPQHACEQKFLPGGSGHQKSFGSDIWCEEPALQELQQQVPDYQLQNEIEISPEYLASRPPSPELCLSEDEIRETCNSDYEFEVDSDIEVDEKCSYHLPENTPIYSNAPITVYESMVSILTTALTFRWTGRCLQAVLELIYVHCSQEDNVFKKSLYQFKKFFSDVNGPLDYEYYCSQCISQCTKQGCATCKENSKLCYLIKLPIADQLKSILTRPGLFDKLVDVKKRPTQGGVGDIYDGRIYQEHVKGGLLGDKTLLSLMWYTDGASLYPSSSMSMSCWPLYLSINEIPYNQRFKKENLLVPVLWCGPVKPPGNILFKVIYQELKELSKGIDIDIPGHCVKTIKANVICGTGDTPARSLVLNMIQFNGEYSCQSCEQKGVTHEKHPGVRLFPYRPLEMIPRTASAMIAYADLGTPEKAYKGCKGPTILSKIDKCFIQSTSIDSMHCTFAGLSKKITKILISSEYWKLPWGISKHIAVLNQRLVSIKPPLNFPRVPRTLDELSKWKTSEHKAWFLYYSLPVLDGILPQSYFIHHASIVTAIQLLSADFVSDVSLEKANVLINKYVAYFEDMYSRNFMTINIHLLLHLPEVVKNLGPLWVTSCFPLEGINGIILSLVHGSRWADKQIAASVQTCLSLPELVSRIKTSQPKNYCENLLNPHFSAKRTQYGKFVVLGTVKLLTDVPLFLNELLNFEHQSKTHDLYTFEKLQKGRYIYVSKNKERVLSRNSSYVTFLLPNKVIEIGAIKLFILRKRCNCPETCFCDENISVVIQKLEIQENFETLVPEIVVPHIHVYEEQEEYVLVSPDSLLSVCVQMVVNNKMYVAVPCNTCEVE